MIRDEGIETGMLRYEHRRQREVNWEMEVSRQAEAGKSEGSFLCILIEKRNAGLVCQEVRPFQAGLLKAMSLVTLVEIGSLLRQASTVLCLEGSLVNVTFCASTVGHGRPSRNCSMLALRPLWWMCVVSWPAPLHLPHFQSQPPVFVKEQPCPSFSPCGFGGIDSTSRAPSIAGTGYDPACHMTWSTSSSCVAGDCSGDRHRTQGRQSRAS